MTAPLVIGVDPSITATGVALSDGSLITVGGKADRGDERLLDIACLIGTACFQADLVVIEFLPAHMKGAGITGMVQGVVRLMCLRADMRMALYQRTGVDVRSNDEVDAAWLRFAGLQKLGVPAVTLPAAQVKALDAVTWPEVARRSAA